VPGQAHVLVVDDKEVVRSFLREVLLLAGHRVTLVESGPAALEVCTRDPVDVVLTDLRMEPMSGQELIERLRGLSPQSVPIVLTGHASVERTVELMRLGAFDVLSKPCRAAEILEAVQEALTHREALLANARAPQPRDDGEIRRQHVQEKLAMIGKLAAGVAHELNNPLDAVLRCVRMSQERVRNDGETSEYLDLAHAGLLRMADIVRSLQTFSREAAVEQAPQRLDKLVGESIMGVTLALGSAAPKFQQALQSRVAAAPLPRGLHQVLTNLLRNAADACGANATVTVRARLQKQGLLLEVIDQGTGIPDQVLPRIFEPFFTTKEPGKGTGLGLPISARIVEKFGGSMSIACPPEGGTVVSVSLPLHGYETEFLSEAS